MHVPFGWVSLLAGVGGAVIFTVSKIRGTDTDFTLLAASLAAFVAGWVACVSVPGFERRIRSLEQANTQGRMVAAKE